LSASQGGSVGPRTQGRVSKIALVELKTSLQWAVVKQEKFGSRASPRPEISVGPCTGKRKEEKKKRRRRGERGKQRNRERKLDRKER